MSARTVVAPLPAVGVRLVVTIDGVPGEHPGTVAASQFAEGGLCVRLDAPIFLRSTPSIPLGAQWATAWPEGIPGRPTIKAWRPEEAS